MESFDLNICKREQGFIFQERTIGNIKGHTLTITNKVIDGLHVKTFHFLHASVHKFGHYFVAGDQSGAVYIFDLERNRFWLVIKLNKCCSAIVLIPNARKDILVATTDCSLHLLDSVTGRRVASVQTRQSCISHISIDKTCERVLTSSLDLAVLRDLKTLNILHSLTVKKSVDFVKAFFLPEKNHVVSAFKDGSVFLWNATSLSFLSQFSANVDDKEMKLRSVEASWDGELIVCGGKVDWIVVWSVESKIILFVMTLGISLTAVKQLSFLPSGFFHTKHHNLAILSQEGNIFLYNLEATSLILKTTCEDCLNMIVASNGKVVVTVTSSGSMKMYDMKELFSLKEKAVFSNRDNHHTLLYNEEKLQKTFQKEARTQHQTEKARFYNLDVNRLYRIVREFGEYPAKYRFFIWKNLLKLPENKEAFGVLVEKGEHRLCRESLEEYPVINQTLKNALLRILSYLTHWCPLLVEVDYLPHLVFPFVKLLHRNLQMCFEVILTLICNWCQNWFLYFPHIPLNILSAIENLLIHHDEILMKYFVSHDITAQVYAWPLLYTAFSEVLPKHHWLQLWDHVMSNEPSFLLYLVVAYSTASRQVLMCLKSFQEIQDYFHLCNSLPVSTLVKEAYRLLETTPPDIHPSCIIGTFFPLSQTVYPVFTKYPQFKVNLQIQDRKGICHEEVNYIQQRQREMDSILNLIQEDEEQITEEDGKVSHRLQTERNSRYLREIQRLHNMRWDFMKEELKKTTASQHLAEDSSQDLKLQKMKDILQTKVLNHVDIDSSQRLPFIHQKEQLSDKRLIKGIATSLEGAPSPVKISGRLNVIKDVLNLRQKLAGAAK